MAFQPIGDSEVQPGAIVSSSLMTRLRDNVDFLYNRLIFRSPGDITLASFDTGVGNWNTAGQLLFRASSPYNGGYRFDFRGGTFGNYVISRNEVVVSAPIPAGSSVDILGWSQGDRIMISVSIPTGTARAIGAIRASVAGNISASLTFNEGVLPQ